MPRPDIVKYVHDIFLSSETSRSVMGPTSRILNGYRDYLRRDKAAEA
jgi:hypothetical protein